MDLDVTSEVICRQKHDKAITEILVNKDETMVATCGENSEIYIRDLNLKITIYLYKKLQI